MPDRNRTTSLEQAKSSVVIGTWENLVREARNAVFSQLLIQSKPRLAGQAVALSLQLQHAGAAQSWLKQGALAVLLPAEL